MFKIGSDIILFITQIALTMGGSNNTLAFKNGQIIKTLNLPLTWCVSMLNDFSVEGRLREISTSALKSWRSWAPKCFFTEKLIVINFHTYRAGHVEFGCRFDLGWPEEDEWMGIQRPMEIHHFQWISALLHKGQNKTRAGPTKMAESI